MDIDGQNENGEDAEEENRMDDNGLAVGGEASELHHAGVSRQLEEQPRREQNEQQQTEQDRRPVQHCSSGSGSGDAAFNKVPQSRRWLFYSKPLLFYL